MNSRPTITVLSPTLTGNATLRTHMLVRLLRKRFTIQLIGFDAAPGVFAPLAYDEMLVNAARYHASNIATWRFGLKRLAKSVRGDLILCFKPLLGSFAAGLFLGRWLRRPVMLDIDDWELGFLTASPFWEARLWGPRWLTSVESPLFTRALDGFIYKAAAVTVSNSFLQALYGGHWIPHARDASTFGASSPSSTNPRVTVLFAGSPRGHKGIPTLLKAWKLAHRSDAVLRFAVPDPQDGSLVALKPQEIANVEVTGPHSFADMPAILREAAIIVVPQDNRPGALGQLPMKLIDGMAAAKPIIASDICDASKWLRDGAGMTVPPGSEDDLAEALSHLLDHRELWDEMGGRARSRFIRFSSESILEKRLGDIVLAALERRAVAAEPAFSPRLSEAPN